MLAAVEKQALPAEELEAQYALELPDREMLGLVTVIINNVLNGLSVNVEVKNNNVAIQVCAVVEVLNTILTPDNSLTCTIGQ
jgi:hypothetical protein